MIDYTLGDYFFQGPDTVPAGTVTFRLKLASNAPHVLDLVRLEQGKRLADLMAAGESAYVLLVGEVGWGWGDVEGGNESQVHAAASSGCLYDALLLQRTGP